MTVHVHADTIDLQRTSRTFLAAAWSMPEAPLTPLKPAQRVRLLEIAREALIGYARRGSRPSITEKDPRLRVHQGVFVTLLLGDRVRACIGVLDAPEPLFQTVADVVLSAAGDDPRDSPIRPDEVARLEIELSILSQREVVAPDAVQVGVHGLLVQQGRSVGALLPQVAPQHGWTREEFLSNACLRAGLAEDAWQDPRTRLEAFTADVFSESTLRRSS